jgi:ABC-type transport system involved in cytochrome c biogenesis permease subunit
MRTLVAAVALALTAAVLPAQERARWDQEVAAAFAGFGVQEEGRLKPFLGYARLKLTQLNGRSSARIGEQSWPAEEWLLELLFRPAASDHDPVFLIANNEVLTAIGVDLEGKRKRDRYSYVELLPARARLAELATLYHGKEARQRTLVEQQVWMLGNNVALYEALRGAFDWARKPLPVADPKLRAILGGSSAPLSEVLRRMPELLPALREMHGGADPFLDELDRCLRGASVLACVPPLQAAEHEWLTIADVVRLAFAGRGADLIADVAAWEKVALAAGQGDGRRLAERFFELQRRLEERTHGRADFATVPREVSYYRADLIYHALQAFVLAALLGALTWLWPRSRWLYRLGAAATVAGALLLGSGIVQRCLINGRPPITHLFETIPAIAFVVVVVALVVEAINRMRIAMPLGAALGALGVFLTMKYEVVEALRGQDTIRTLEAVLDSNFWLATHVLTINFGYAAGLLAGAFAHVFLLGKLLGAFRGRPEVYRSITRMTYGALCFSLLLSVVGTILGGVWANDSWGRFWGWDPKENGALMICLAELAILHGRMGGYLRDFGLALGAVFNNVIIAFSWWGVNLLGIGLHSYGWTDAVGFGLLLFYGVELGVLALGGAAWLRERRIASGPVVAAADAQG